MAEKKSGGTKRPASRSSGSTGRSKSASARSKKAAELEAQRIREEALRRSMRRRHICSVVLCAAGVLLTLMAVIPGSEGWNALYNVMHGLFGLAAYAAGPLMIYAAIVISANKTGSTITFTVVKIILFMIMLCAAAEIFGVGKINGENFGEVCASLYNGGTEFHGGGFFALVLGVPLLFLGKFGACAVIIIIALVCVFLMTNLSLSDLGSKISALFGSARDAVSERRERLKTENALADEEYERMEQERRVERQLAQDRKRFQKEIDEEQKQRAKLERIKKVVYSVDGEGAEQSAPKPEPAPKKPVHEPEGIKIPEQADNTEIIKEQEEDNRDYREALRKYMEKRHPIMRDPVQPDPERLEDKDADLVPIIDALSEFDKEHSAPARVSKIIDAPKSDIITSDDKPADVTDTDEAELPFDLDEMINETRRAAEPKPVPPKAPEKPLTAPTKTRGEQLKLSDVYTLPPVTLLNPVKQRVPQADIDVEIRGNADKLVETLKSFGVSTTYLGASRGPSVTRYELQPAPGVKISKISNLADDVALNLATSGVRIAPVPNKAAVGIEIPNTIKDTVYFRELVDTTEFRQSFDKKLVTVLGKDISGNTVTCNVSKMPHLLIAGTTGSGKSVCVNSIIMSILMKSTPTDVRLIMVDPKQVEFMMYNGIPHLLIPVVTDPKKAAGALAWAVTEMDNRYTMFSENNVRNIDGFNELAADPDTGLEKMPHIVIFIDELADLMMASPKDVEDSIVRLAQKARAAGMHLVIATQKPTVQVVTGLIKGNIPSRIALMVASQIDSRVILDASGAEKLLGNGDMLYMPVGVPKPIRLQGCYVSDDEVERVVEFIKQTFTVEYDESIMAEIERQTEIVNSTDSREDDGFSEDGDETDEKLEDAIELVVNAGQASTSAIQRNLKLGYGRAARLMDVMEKMGIIGPFEGAKPRQVLMTKQEWYERKLQK